MTRRQSRREILSTAASVAVLFLIPGVGQASTSLPSVVAYRNPGCGCCERWAENMEAAGFAVTMSDDPNLADRRSKLGVPSDLAGCHLALVGDYVIEGHVPPEDVLSFLASKPNARGLAVPGMPVGSSGMEMGDTKEAYDVLIYTADGKSQVYARH